ncbi:hypothetical protein QQZ08_004009 [Neonectria magnoliae]|uniref:Amine oxidase domain-containing protein n=1 Tax=Neonectria magnoliae TaxID=2732573 RepID=A0ABR1I769_9HYPO
MATKEIPKTNSYKHQWARHVARKTLQDDLATARALVKDATSRIDNLPITLNGKESVTRLLTKTKDFTGLGFVPPEQGKINIGIVGAGVGGLFTAMAAGEERLGGRLYTHKFSDKEHDYYDVGAMRFPNNEIMTKTFQLFKLLGLEPGRGGLIPYYLPDEDNKVCPSYFNDVNCVGYILNKEGLEDPFRINTGLSKKDEIPEEYMVAPKSRIVLIGARLLKKDPAKLVSAALHDFIKDTVEKFENSGDEIENGELQGDGEQGTKLWKHLMKADNMSVRQFLSSGTGWYDQALSECVLDELDFATPEQEEGKPKRNFWCCVDGGGQRIARLMAEKVKKPVQLNSQVVAINANVPKRRDPNTYVPMTLDIKRTDPVSKQTDLRKEDYFAVLNSPTLPALQRMNLKDAGLLWGTKQAIRSLGYGASCKVEPFNINKGGLSRTDLPVRVCVFPSYNISEIEEHWDSNGSSVLLCSYTWGQDAQRLGSLISPDTADNEEQLKGVLLHNLALLHANEKMSYDELMVLLDKQYETHHAWDWYRNLNMSGAFAYSGPGQFSNMWEEIIKPNAFGQLYMIGEAASSHHAWIVGALESVTRAIYVMFEGLNSNDPGYEAYTEVMNLLSQAPQEPVAGELPSGLPFYPLPEEMPKRQDSTERGAPRTNDPAVNDKPLTYPAAIASLSLVESYFELVYSAQVA